MDELAQIVPRHVTAFFAGHEVHQRRWPRPPAEVRIADLSVLEIGPGPQTELWTYITVGASSIRRDGHGFEFFLHADGAYDGHVELVTTAAHYHAGERTGRLDIGHTFPIGRPWMPDSPIDHLLISTGYVLPDELTELPVDGGAGLIQLAWLVPIYEREKTFRHEHGLEALEDKFEAAGLHYWDPQRPSVV